MLTVTAGPLGVFKCFYAHFVDRLLRKHNHFLYTVLPFSDRARTVHKIM